MKERFSKLLLGEDMSGSGKGVCTAVTISNAITNLYGNFKFDFFFFLIFQDFLSSFILLSLLNLCNAASVFGQHQRLEPLHLDKKLMWKREMNCLLSVCDYIVEFSPSLQNLKDGTTLEVKDSSKSFLATFSCF